LLAFHVLPSFLSPSISIHFLTFLFIVLPFFLLLFYPSFPSLFACTFSRFFLIFQEEVAIGGMLPVLQRLGVDYGL